MNQPKNKPGRRGSDSRRDDGDFASQTSAWSRTLRETIESIAIAFMLAFLFRTFEAEAFVIPTGSMAPTLMGKHLDITCPNVQIKFLPRRRPCTTTTKRCRGRCSAARVSAGLARHLHLPELLAIR